MPETPPPINERLASAKAIAEAMIGVPIVVAQQIVQNVADLRIGRDTTVAARVNQLRMLGEMTVRLGSRELARRLGGRRQ
jgi:hypothetical protein